MNISFRICPAGFAPEQMLFLFQLYISLFYSFSLFFSIGVTVKKNNSLIVCTAVQPFED